MSLSQSILSPDLIAGCLRNDRRSQEILYKRYFDALLAIARAYSGKEQDAVEILQDSFLKIFQHINRFDSTKSSLYTWMRTIVVRTAIDFLRRNKNSFQVVDWEEKYDPEVDPEILQRMSASEIMDMLKQLTDVTRTVFNLFITEGYTHNEIATLLNIKEGTSKWHLSEARKHLMSSLKKQQRA